MKESCILQYFVGLKCDDEDQMILGFDIFFLPTFGQGSKHYK